MAKPIFVVGCTDSGTTPMRRMLGSHPAIMIAEETGFLRSVNAIRSIPFWNARDKWIKRIGVTSEELDRSIEEFYDEVFGLAAGKQGATRWGDETPFHVEFIAAAARVFPEAVFVGVVRHPGAVASSLVGQGWSWNTAVRHWCAANEWLLEGGLSVGDRLRTWRYEDLVDSAESVMREVLHFVDEPWDPRVLEHHGDPGGTAAAVGAGSVGTWEDGVSESDRDVLVGMAGPLAAFFGYDVQRSLPARPLAGAPAAGLGASAAAWADRADELWDLPRHIEGHAFENSMYTQADLGVELGAAYRSGARGGLVRPPYRDMLPADRGGSLPVGPPVPGATPAPPVTRARRRLARMVRPDR